VGDAKNDGLADENCYRLPSFADGARKSTTLKPSAAS